MSVAFHCNNIQYSSLNAMRNESPFTIKHYLSSIINVLISMLLLQSLFRGKQSEIELS